MIQDGEKQSDLGLGEVPPPSWVSVISVRLLALAVVSYGCAANKTVQLQRET